MKNCGALRKQTSLVRSEKGAALVEFALVLPLLLVIFLGVVEFGLIMYNKQVLTNATREGARFGILAGVSRKTDDEITVVVNNYGTDFLISFGSAGSPTITFSRTGTSFGDNLTVRAAYNYEFLLLPDFFSSFFGESSLPGSLNLASETTMKYE